MKETPLSTCEKTFILQAIKQNQRLDGRKNDEFRKIKISYGADWGSVIVALGETRVVAQVSSELGEPKATRPNEGMLHINVELGPMAAPHFEASRNSELTVQLNRTLERTFKDSKCMDLESLCILAEEQVWILRVDVNVLNHEGNLVDCCSIATLCALAHFRKPDVSLVEDNVVIHTSSEKDPLPMVMHHYPVCVSYCTFDDGRIAVADPTVMEERTSESQMVFGINSFRELCCLNLGGSSLTSPLLLLQCSKRASEQAKYVVGLVKQTLEKDFAARDSGRKIGFTECVNENSITSLAEDRLVLKLRHFSFQGLQSDLSNAVNSMSIDEAQEPNGLQDLIEAAKEPQFQANKWDIPATQNERDIEMDSDGGDEEAEVNRPKPNPMLESVNTASSGKKTSKETSNSDSEEEEQLIL